MHPAVALVSPILLWFWYRCLARKRLLENVPTSKVKGVFLGQVEVKGRAVPIDALRSYLAEAACVFYRYTVKERWSRTVTETDSEGKTRTRHESGWRTVAEGGEDPPFLLRDRTGEIRVDPGGAEVQATTVFDETVGRRDPLYYAKGPSDAVWDSDHRRRFREEAIEVGARVYVLGTARQRDDVVAPEIARSRHPDDVYLISTGGEERLRSGYGWKAGFALVGAGVTAGFGAAAAGPEVLTGALIAFAVAVAVGYAVLVRNGLVSVRERAEMARSLIDVELRRRHVLIPRLAGVVRAYADYEKTTQEDVVAARRGDPGSQTRALRALFALAEDYPELKAAENFRRLHDELVDTEDRIALAREFHNATVTALNNRIETLPDSLIAKLTAFRPGALFEAEGFERTAAKSDLGGKDA